MRVHVMRSVPKKEKSVVVPIIAINIFMFVLSSMGFGFIKYLILNPPVVMQMPWQLVTHMFLHADIFHLFFNMWVLYMFGTLLEQKIGNKRFLMVYFGSGILAAIGHSIFVGVPALGASGGVMGVMGTLMVLMPDLPVILMFFPMRLWIAGIVIALIDLFAVIPGVANLAHLIGLGSGILYGLTLKEKRDKYQRKFSRKKHLDEDEVEEFLRTGRI